MAQPITLSASLLASLQLCQRKLLLGSQFKPRRPYPTSLFSRALRNGIFLLSQGADPEDAISTATSAFMDTARYGLDVVEGIDVYRLASDYCAQLKTILIYLSRLTLLTLQTPPLVQLPNGLTWEPDGWIDDSGTYHQWHVVRSIDRDTVIKHLHDWPVAGNTLATDAPMVLHLVAAGTTHNGRRISPFCRAFKDPTIPGRYRFNKVSGAALHNTWKELFLSENVDNDCSAWVDVMQTELDMSALVRHLHIDPPNKIHRDNFLRDMEKEYVRIVELFKLRSPFDAPMHRTSCDTPWPCHFQEACYSTSTQDLESTGRYTRLTMR